MTGIKLVWEGYYYCTFLSFSFDWMSSVVATLAVLPCLSYNLYFPSETHCQLSSFSFWWLCNQIPWWPRYWTLWKQEHQNKGWGEEEESWTGTWSAIWECLSPNHRWAPGVSQYGQHPGTMGAFGSDTQFNPSQLPWPWHWCVYTENNRSDTLASATHLLSTVKSESVTKSRKSREKVVENECKLRGRGSRLSCVSVWLRRA